MRPRGASLPVPASVRQRPADVAIYEDNWNPSDPDEYARLYLANLVPRLQHFDDNEQENILNFSGNPDDADDESEDSGNEDGSEEADDLDRDLDENGQGADADAGENDVEGEEGEEDDEDAQDDELPFNAAAVGLKEISNLASFTVSSYKPGCGVRELRDDDINLFWQ